MKPRRLEYQKGGCALGMKLQDCTAKGLPDQSKHKVQFKRTPEQFRTLAIHFDLDVVVVVVVVVESLTF